MLSWRRIFGPSAVLIGTTAGINVLRILNAVVLTRLLSPDDFGLVGIVISIFFAINMLTDAGFQPFVIRHERGAEPSFLDAVWTIHVGRALLNTGVAVLLSFPLAWLLDKPQLATLLAVAALTMVVDGCASLTLLVALRENMVRRLSMVDLAVFLVQLVSGLAAAWVLRSVWALILSMFLASIVRTSASYLFFPNARRRLRFDRAVFGELWGFSRVIAASSALTLAISQFDKLILARVFSLRQFGVYSVANNLAVAPTQLAYLYSGRIIYPALAETWRERPDGLRKRFYAQRGLVFYVYLAGTGAIIGGASLIVGLLYDQRYQGASLYLGLLTITTAMTMLTQPVKDLLMVTGRVRATLVTNIVRIAWLAVAAPAGLVWMGPIGLIVALAMIEVPAYLYGASQQIKFGLYSVRHELLAFAAIGGGVAIGLLAAWIIPPIHFWHHAAG